MSRPPRQPVYLFVVDSHDEILRAPAGSTDREALEQLKQYNAAIAQAVGAAWTAAGLPTEKSYLRGKIRQTLRERTQSGESDEEDGGD